ncbi:ATP-binding protein [Geminisphaera colitermitum]|uniref:ATP-binding protein n=1 Tax=Geminisphaera colitermitum TaxID=1148786 RepID=UPI000158D570
MPTTPAQIDFWRSAPTEYQRLEFKEAKNQYDNQKLFRYCVALANEGGGHLLLGIADKPPRKVVGTQAFNNPVAMEARLFEMLGFRVDIEEVAHPDGRVLVFHIPSRPKGTAYHFEGAYLMRSGSELVPMSEDQLRRIFSEGAPDWLAEPAATNLTDETVVQLLDVQTYFDLLKRPYPLTRDGVIDYLRGERLIVQNARGWSISRLGALLLARKLEDFPSLARKAARIVVYNGNSKLETKLDHVDVKGYAVGFKELVSLIMSQLPQNEVIEDAIRKEVKLVPEIVIRELVANALIHQDFLLSGVSVMIEIYASRVEISNPGEPIVPTERFIDGYESRNERLADLMRRLGICEEKSSGIDKVIHAAEIFQLQAPLFRTGLRRTLVVIAGAKKFADMDRDDRIRACYQHCALRYVMRQETSNQSLRARFHLPEGKSVVVSQVLAATVEAGLIKVEDETSSRKFARYVPFWA